MPGSTSPTLPPAASDGCHHHVLILDVDDADLVAVLGIERILEAFRRIGNELRIVDHDLARIDMADAVGIFHRRDDVRGIRQLGIVDLLAHAGLVHLEHVGGGKPLNVGGAARQALLGDHLAAAWRVAGLILRDVVALRLEERILDVLRQQPRIVAAPGADHDAAAFRAGIAQKRRQRRARQGPVRVSADASLSYGSCSVLRFCQFDLSAKTIPASRCQPTVTSSPNGRSGFAAVWQLRHHAIGRRQSHVQRPAPRPDMKRIPPCPACCCPCPRRG